MTDPIVDEIHRIRDAHAARFNYDLDAIFQDIKARERESGLVFHEGVARQSLQEPLPVPTVPAGIAPHSADPLPAVPADGTR